jgi:hypothetical protein
MRWLALADDPIAGGTRYDDVVADPAALVPPVSTDLLVATASNVDDGRRDLNRDNDVRGTRANSAPISFASAPSLTFSARAWTSQVRKLLRRAIGGTVTPTGAPPAAVESSIQMLQSQTGNLPALIATLVREQQVDRLTGGWIDELTFNFPADEEGTIEGTVRALYRRVDDVDDVAPALPALAGGVGQSVAYMLRDVIALEGPGAGVQIDCLGGFGMTLNNNLSDDFRTRFCAGRNIEETTIDAVLHRLWFPDKNRVGSQTITGRLDFGDTRPEREARKLVAHADKLVVELYGDPLGTTPAADESVRLIFHKHALTGGGAEPLAREGDQQSSYEFTAYVDDVTGKDLEAVVASTAAVT